MNAAPSVINTYFKCKILAIEYSVLFHFGIGLANLQYELIGLWCFYSVIIFSFKTCCSELFTLLYFRGFYSRQGLGVKSS